MTVDRGATEAEALQASNLATKLMAQRDDDEVMVMNDVLASITALRKQFDQVAPGEYSRKRLRTRWQRRMRWCGQQDAKCVSSGQNLTFDTHRLGPESTPKRSPAVPSAQVETQAFEKYNRSIVAKEPDIDPGPAAPRYSTRPLLLTWTWAKCACASLRSSLIAPVALVVPLPISAIRNEKPCGRSIRARCSAPVTGLRIGSPTVSTKPGIASRPRRASTSISNSIGRNSGSSLFGHMAEKTHHPVAISSVSSP